MNNYREEQSLNSLWVWEDGEWYEVFYSKDDNVSSNEFNIRRPIWMMFNHHKSHKQNN